MDLKKDHGYSFNILETKFTRLITTQTKEIWI